MHGGVTLGGTTACSVAEGGIETAPFSPFGMGLDLLCHISTWHYVFSPHPPPDPACGGVEEAENSLPFKGRVRVGMGYHGNLTK